MCIHERQLLLESFLFNYYFYFFFGSFQISLVI